MWPKPTNCPSARIVARTPWTAASVGASRMIERVDEGQVTNGGEVLDVPGG